MKKKIVIHYNNHNVNIQSELQGQELYEVYVALTAHIAQRLNNPKDIEKMSNQAIKDAMKLLKKFS